MPDWITKLALSFIHEKVLEIAGFDIYTVNPQNCVPYITVPTFMIIADDDAIIPFD
jgi:hypothetical protein